MALKDLIAPKGAFEEAAIEKIVGPYVRYDVDHKEIVLLPPFRGLSNRGKILVYLVALQGWRFVTDDVLPNDARPADLELATGIPGGSLRPTLRELCDQHVLTERDSRYSIRGTSLPTVEAEIDGGERPDNRRRSRSPKPRGSSSESDTVSKSDGDDVVKTADTRNDVREKGVSDGDASNRRRKAGSKTGNIAATFDRWIDEGYFDTPRTMADVQQRFRREALLVRQTSLPGYFLAAVRKGRLSRDETQSGGKTVWAYSSTTKAGT